MAQRQRAPQEATLCAGSDLHVEYVPVTQLSSLQTDTRIMAAVQFGSRTWSNAAEPWRFGVGLQPLDVATDMVEVWRASDTVRSALIDGVALRLSPHYAFGHVLVNEDEHPDLQAATRSAYDRILSALREHGHPHLIRVWHYFPDIGAVEHGIERYQAFCVGRHEALSAASGFERTLPAATAIGTRVPGLLMYFIAARTPPVQIENPRQVSAFRYPPQYSPRSPSFSRAVRSGSAHEASLYVSGTASVVGHATRHRDQLHGQLQETVNNLTALFAQASAGPSHGFRLPDDLKQLKVYLRDHDDLHAARTFLEPYFNAAPILYLQGDVCRADLKVEIEGISTVPVTA